MAFSINTVTVDGNLTKDPELRSTPSGTSVCKLRIAHNAREKRGGDWQDVPYFFDVTVWSGTGEWIANNCSKGTKVVVQGRLQWREWETQEGGKRQAVDITADNIVVMRESSGGQSQRYSAPDVPADTSGLGTAAPVGPAGADDDIPF